MSAITRQFDMQKQEREQRADARRRQRGKNRDRMDEAFIQDAQNDVDREQRRGDQDRLIGERFLIGLRGPLETSVNVGGQVDLALRFIDGGHSISERHADGQG